VLAEGQFNFDVDAADSAIFIDCSVRGFQVSWDYMVGDLIGLDNMSEVGREILCGKRPTSTRSIRCFLAPPPQFSTKVYSSVSFSTNNRVVTRMPKAKFEEDNSFYVMSSTPFVIPENADFVEKRIKLVSLVVGSILTFGLAPANLMSSDPFIGTDNCGYHCDTDMELTGENAENGVQFREGSIEENSILHFRLHRDKTISIVLNGEDLGVAFRDVNTSELLYLVVKMSSGGDCVELLPDRM
jgi:hypothetical protein